MSEATHDGLVMPAVGSEPVRQQVSWVFVEPGLDGVTVGWPAFQRVSCRGLGVMRLTSQKEEGFGEGVTVPQPQGWGRGEWHQACPMPASLRSISLLL